MRKRSGNHHPSRKLTPETANINPKGVNQWTALPPELIKLKAMTKEDHVRVVTALLKMNKTELSELMRSEKANVHELLAGACIFLAITKGDIYVYEKIMDRVVGRVPLPVEHSGQIVNATINLDEKEKKHIREIGAFIARSKDSVE